MNDSARLIYRILAAALTPAPPPPTVYEEPPSELDVIVTNLRYRKLIRDQERLVKVVLADLKNERGLREQKQEIAFAAESARLHAEIASLREANSKIHERFKREASLPNSRSGLFRVLVTAIVRGYGREVLQGRPPKSIAVMLSNDAMEILGLTVDPKTARRYVREAAAMMRAADVQRIP